MLLFALRYFGGVSENCYPIPILAASRRRSMHSLASRAEESLANWMVELITGMIVLLVASFLGGFLLLAVECKYSKEGKIPV